MSSSSESLTYLEFYSGVGGWSYALHAAVKRLTRENNEGGEDDTSESRLNLKCLGAFDHSDLCNKVYSHNFPPQGSNVEISVPKTKKRKKSSSTKSVSIESLTKKNLEESGAFMWMMSPPCQPHTRQHNNQKEDMIDPRSKSFIHLCEMITSMQQETLPRIIVLENVIGFEESNSCRMFRKALKARRYNFAHFHLNPTQCNIPNNRPRHYTVAVMYESSSNFHVDMSKLKNIDNNKMSTWFECVKESIEYSIDDKTPINSSIDPLQVQDPTLESDVLALSEFLDAGTDRESLLVPDKILGSNSSWCFDFVTPSDKRSSCVTSSYGRFVRGTGSVIYDRSIEQGSNDMTASILEKIKLVKPEERQFDETWNGMDLKGDLRYFSGMELAKLFGFPTSKGQGGEAQQVFSFPSDCTLKQQWKLLGNSINVVVASKICEVALTLYAEQIGDDGNAFGNKK